MEVLASGAALEKAKISPDADDLKPEYCNYKDEGCIYAPACLKCPFPKCIYDEPGGRQHWMKNLRDREIIRRFRAGEKVKLLAEDYEVSERTVQRAINKK